MKYVAALVILLASGLGMATESQSPIEVKVGMYPFAPFVEFTKDQQYEGMTVELIQALNELQNDYQFIPVSISPKRRYQAFNDGEYDVIFYESLQWGWEGIEIDASDVYQTGGEVYVALKTENRTQSFFSDFSKKRMVGMLGYHYGFADFNADEDFLRQTYRMLLTWNNQKGLDLLLAKRGDIAVVTQAYLKRYLLQHPELKNRLLISDKFDQKYQHTALVRPNIQPSVQDINRMIKTLQQTDAWHGLLSRYGISGAAK